MCLRLAGNSLGVLSPTEPHTTLQAGVKGLFYCEEISGPVKCDLLQVINR